MSNQQESTESSHKESSDSIHSEVARRYSHVSKLVHYTSKFAINPEEHRSTLQTPVRQQQAPSRIDRRRSTIIERFASF